MTTKQNVVANVKFVNTRWNVTDTVEIYDNDGLSEKQIDCLIESEFIDWLQLNLYDKEDCKWEKM